MVHKLTADLLHLHSSNGLILSENGLALIFASTLQHLFRSTLPSKARSPVTEPTTIS